MHAKNLLLLTILTEKEMISVDKVGEKRKNGKRKFTTFDDANAITEFVKIHVNEFNRDIFLTPDIEVEVAQRSIREELGLISGFGVIKMNNVAIIEGILPSGRNYEFVGSRMLPIVSGRCCAVL